jgi:hypothetical protein
MKYSGDAESVEWFNMAFRKVVWRLDEACSFARLPSTRILLRIL